MLVRRMLRICAVTITSAIFVLLITNLTVQSASSAPTAVSQRLVATHNFGGVTAAVIGEGNTLYYGRGAELVVADITNPTAPTELGSWSGEYKSGFFNAHLDGDRLYLPREGFTGIEVLDVSNSAQPVKLGSIPPLFIGGRAYLPSAVATSGDYAFVLQGNLFRVLDMSAPVSPVDVTYITPGSFLDNIVISGNYAYVSYSSGIHIVDISTPGTPTVVDQIALSSVVNIERSGTLLYVATSASVFVYDISTPESPTEVGEFSAAYTIRQMTTHGSYVYINSSPADGLYVIDFSDPANPVEAASLSVPLLGFGVYATGTALYAGGSANGLVIVDITNPVAPALAGTIDKLTRNTSVALAANQIFATSGQTLWLMQLQPLVASGTQVWSSSLFLGDINGVGNLLYVAKSDNVSGFGVLEILNVETPGAPTSLGEVQLSIQGAERVIVAGDYAYVGSWRGISVVNISDLTAPTETQYVFTSGNVRDLKIQGQYLYAATTDGLLIYDISNPAVLALVGEYTSIFANGVDVINGYAFVAGSANMQIIDVSSPSTPTYVRTINTCGTVSAVSISESFVYVLDGCDRVAMYDASDPVNGSSFTVSSADIPGSGSKIIVEGADLYVASYHGGFVKLERLEYTSEIIPAEGGVLNSPDNTSTVMLPSGTFTDSVQLRYDEEPAMPTGNLSAAGGFFSLSMRDTVNWELTPLPPGGTMTVTVQYEAQLPAGGGLALSASQHNTNAWNGNIYNEETLQLYRWQNGAWITEGITSSVDTEANEVTAVLTAFSGEETFALLGESYRLYLPAILR